MSHMHLRHTQIHIYFIYIYTHTQQYLHYRGSAAQPVKTPLSLHVHELPWLPLRLMLK